MITAINRYKPIQRYTILLLILCVHSCGNPSKMDSTNDATVDTIQGIAQDDAKNHPIIEDRNQLNEIKNAIIEQCGHYEDLSNKGLLFSRYVEMEEVYGDTYFHDGQIYLVSWHDEELGINGSYRCYFNENSEVTLIERFNHDGRTCSATYYRLWNDEIVPFSYIGQFPKDGKYTYSEASYDEQLAATGALSKEDYNKIVRIAKSLAHAALSNQEATIGTRYYKGTIANDYPIQVNLNLSTNFIRGAYHYDNSDEALSIYGDVVNGLVQLKEKNPSDDKITGFFKGSIAADGSMFGWWNNADKTKEFPFELQPSETYTTTNGTVVKGLSQGLPEIFHQEIKTNYFDIPEANSKLAAEVLGATINEPISWLSEAEMKIRDKLYNMFIEKSDYFFDDKINSDYGDIVANYFREIYLALPDFVSKKERHTGYYNDLPKAQTLKDKWIPYFIYRIDRSSENIFVIWNLYKSHFFEKVDRDTYENLKLDQTVNELLKSYGHIQRTAAFDSVLGRAYRLTDSLNQKKIALDHDSGPYGISSEDQYPFLRELMQNDNETYTRKLWSYSFWMRRNHEGNLEIVASLLKEIQGHYQ